MKAVDLAKADDYILRQRDFASASVHDDFKRFVNAGVILRVCRGAYVRVPEAHRQPNVTWRPPLERVALGLAAVEFGDQAVALVGPSAARAHGVIPRALPIATVSYPSTRPRDISTVCGTVRTYRRRVDQMDVVHHDNDLIRGQVTSVEMTMLDLASAAPKWPIGDADRMLAVRLLAARSNWEVATEIAEQYRKKASLVNVKRLLDEQGNDRDT